MSTPHNGAEGRLSRRSYLGLTGAAVLGAIASRTVSASTHETVTVAEGEREIVEIGDSETLENVLFDVTAPGAGVTIIAKGTNWTIRNVAVEGEVEMGNHTILGVADTDNGTSSIENVWLGDGSAYEEKGATGLWVDPAHDGHLEIDGVNIQNMSDNAFYCSAPGDDHGCGGTVAIRNSYAANSWVSHFRLSSGTVENCVASVTSDRQYRKGRGIWAWSPGDVDVRNCHLDMNGHHYSFVAGANGEGSRINVSDTEWDDTFYGGWRTIGDGTVNFEGGNGTNPQNIVPDGCPASVEEALGIENDEPEDDDPADDDPVGDEPGDDESDDGTPSLDTYRDPDTGRVEIDGFWNALSDWQNGDIGTQLLLDVLGAWASN